MLRPNGRGEYHRRYLIRALFVRALVGAEDWPSQAEGMIFWLKCLCFLATKGGTGPPEFSRLLDGE